MAGGRKIRALVIAESANPEWVSVPLVGWSHAQALTEVADVHVVTQVRNKEAIERSGWTDGQEFTSIDTEWVAASMYKAAEKLRGGDTLGWTTVQAMTTPAYYAFEAAVLKKFGRQIRNGAFDVIHRVTPLSPATPSLLGSPLLRAKVPFVLGPINGGVPWPKQFDGLRQAEREWLSYVRGAYRFLPAHRTTLKHANALVVGSRETLRQMPAKFHDRCVYLPENAIDPQRFGTTVAKRPSEGPVKIVFVGRLVPLKGADMLLEALAPAVRRGDVEIDILGDGPQMPELKKLHERLGLGEGVRLDGWVPHDKLQDTLTQASLLVFPSVREFGGGVVLEAMACGVVPMVVDYGGPGELVTSDTGHLIQMASRDEIVSEIRKRVDQIIAAPRAELHAQGQRARDYVMSTFTWQAKAQQMLAIYRWVMGDSDKPEFGTPLDQRAAACC